MINLLAIPACAILNYLAGRYEWMGPLRGRPLLYVAPAVTWVAFVVLGWKLALCVGLAYILWRGFSWGHLYQLGNYVPTDRPMPLHEQWCLWLGGGNIYLGAMIRHAYMLPLALVLPLSLAFPPLAVLAYHIANKVGRPVVLAEPIVGALWGLIILSGVYYAVQIS